MQSFHDWTISRFDWNLEECYLKLTLRPPQEGKDVELTFVGLAGWNLDDAVGGCIISSLSEVDRSTYLESDADYIEKMSKQTFNIVVEAVREGDVRVFCLESSYGLYGYFMANDLQIRT
jgi:hypothetical protein